MRAFSWLHRRLAWLALCAVVFGAFAPMLSPLLAPPAHATLWADVCTADGPQRTALDRYGDTDSDHSPDLTGAHCGYCILQHHCPALPTVATSWQLPPLAATRLRLGAGHTTVFQRFVRSAHPTRAPPALA